MGKLTGIITGLATVSILGFFVFSQYFAPLVNWLNPFFGPVVYIIFGLIFFLFADPLAFPVLLISEIGIGLLIGVSARKGSRAVGAAISVYALSWLIVLLSVFYLATETGLLSSAFSGFSSGSSGLSGLITAIPPGTNLATIMAEPVFRRLPLLLPTLTSGISSGNGSIGVTGVVSRLLPLIEPSIINFIAFVVSAGIFGMIVGMLLKRKPMKPVSVEPEPEKSTPAALIVLLALVLIVPVAMVGHAPVNDSNSAVYGGMQQAYVESFTASVLSGLSGQGPLSDFPFTGFSPAYMPSASTSTNSTETAGYLISKNGTLYSAYAFFDPASGSSNAFSNLSGYAGLDFALGVQLASPENLFYGLQFSSNNSSSGPSMSTVLNLIPPELLALGFSSNVSASQAQKLANSYFKLMGISRNVLIVSFSGSSFAGVNLPFSGNIYLYGATAPFSTVASAMAGNYTDRIHSNGLMTVYNRELRSGFIVPGSQTDPVGGTVIVSGFMNSSSLGQMFSIGDLNQTGLVPNGTTNFLISFSSNDFAYSYKDSKIPLQLSDFTGSTDSFSFSSTGASMLMALYPGNGTNSNVSANLSIPGGAGYSGLLYTDSFSLSNATGFNTSLPTQGLVPQGYTFSPGIPIGNITMNLTGEVAQSVSLAAVNSKRLEITVTIYDNSTHPISNVTSEISPGVNYGQAVSIVSGSMNRTITSIGAGSSYTYNVTVSVNNSGTYYLSPSLVQYTYNGSTYSRYSQSASAKVGAASYIQSYTAVFNSAAERFLGPSFVSIPGTAIPLFLVLIALIILADVYIEYRALKRWLKR